MKNMFAKSLAGTVTELVLLLSVLFMSPAASAASVKPAGGPSVLIPRPAQAVEKEGVFRLQEVNGVYISAPKEVSAEDVESLISAVVGSRTGCSGQMQTMFNSVSRRRDAKIEIILGSPVSAQDESYSLKVRPDRVVLRAHGTAGAYYGWQSVLQMLDFGNGRELQCCEIEDCPRFSWRGVHFDVSRHFRSKEFIMKQMDAMAFFRMNKAHLHLTDAAGWRLRIESLPRLSSYAAWRPQADWSDWSKSPEYSEEGSVGAYGGYYTREDIREIVEYARQRHIEVIPEIEMPGHSEEFTAAYPEISCHGKPSDLCPGNEKTFEYIEKVLTEVMEMFPSEYIHIGGDEAGKADWKTCPLCRKRMDDDGLDNVDELQSYLIRRVEAFVNSKGRKIIGWDEILSGGLAPNATVMSWRGTEGGVTAMQEGHDVIMAPGKYCYLDHCQDAPFKEPVSIGGYLPVESVYSYNPADDIPENVSAGHLLGVQACLWAEYIPTDSHCEYMYWPRVMAIAETGWTDPGLKDFADFRRRAIVAGDCLRERGYTVFDLAAEYGERHESEVPLRHLGAGCKVHYGSTPSDSYLSSGETALADGICGGWSYGDGRWQGFLSDFDVTVDLGKTTEIHYAGATFMQSKGAWIYMPEKVEISVSDDGVDFRPVAQVLNDIGADNEALLLKTFGSVLDCSARYVRVTATRGPVKQWLFTDEIVIN